MSHAEHRGDTSYADTPPGVEHAVGHETSESIPGYLVGLGLATLLTIVSFVVARTTLVWEPSIPVALAVLAIAQMGVHLVFFIHITTAPDNSNNVMALAFGVLIVLLILGGSLWIMTNMSRNMTVMNQTMQMQQ